MKNNILFVVNPVSGNKKGLKTLYAVRKYCEEIGLEADYFISEYKGCIPEKLNEIAKNYTTIISVGGDGTLNEIINSINFTENKSFGIVPVGSGNDFWKNFKKEFNLKSFINGIKNESSDIFLSDVGNISILNRQKERREALFFNSVGIGLDSLIAYYHQNHKTISGVLSYFWALLKSLRVFNSISVYISAENIKLTGKKKLVTIGNGICSGGGFYLTPKADISDQLLDVCAVDNVSLFKLFRELPKAMVNKLNTDIEEIDYFQSDNISIKLKEPFYVHNDGEILTTDATEVQIGLLKRKVKFIY